MSSVFGRYGGRACGLPIMQRRDIAVWARSQCVTFSSSLPLLYIMNLEYDFFWDCFVLLYLTQMPPLLNAPKVRKRKIQDEDRPAAEKVKEINKWKICKYKYQYVTSACYFVFSPQLFSLEREMIMIYLSSTYLYGDVLKEMSMIDRVFVYREW